MTLDEQVLEYIQKDAGPIVSRHIAKVLKTRFEYVSRILKTLKVLGFLEESGKVATGFRGRSIRYVKINWPPPSLQE